jgi:hypothetical protein
VKCFRNVALNLTAGYSRCGWGYFLFFLNGNYNTKHFAPLAYNGRQYKIVLDYEAQTCRTARTLKREKTFNNRTKPSMFYIACCA